MPTEIERKFLLSANADPPTLGAGVRLRQGYLAVEDGTEVRVRISDLGATLTVKGGSGRTRTEVEVPVDDAAAEELWALCGDRRLEKVRHRLDLGSGLVAELDRYEGALAGLRVVEVEFPTEASADAFAPPAWFGAEITGRPGWSNAELSRHGVPA